MARKHFTEAERAEIIRQTRQPGATVSAVAKQHGIHEVTLYAWRGRANKAEKGESSTRKSSTRKKRATRKRRTRKAEATAQDEAPEAAPLEFPAHTGARLAQLEAENAKLKGWCKDLLFRLLEASVLD